MNNRLPVRLLKIRFLQLFRDVGSIGLFRILLLLGIIVPAFFLFLNHILSKATNAYLVMAGALLLIFILHRNRKDYRFLYKLSANPALVFCIEYFTFSLPLLPLFLVHGQWLPVLFFYCGLVVISFTVPAPRNSRTFSSIIKYIPATMFEWQSGFRQSWFVILLFWLAGLGAFQYIGLGAVSAGFLTFIFFSFYLENEPRKMLEAYELPAGKFLMKKISGHLSCFLALLVPVLLCSLWYGDYYLYIFSVFLAAINLFAGGILLKYAYYRPGNISGVTGLIGTVMLLCTVILPLSVLVLAFNIFLFFKAKRNLNQYLYAYS